MNSLLRQLKEKARLEIDTNKIHHLESEIRNDIFKCYETKKQRSYLLLHTLLKCENVWDEERSTDLTWKLFIKNTFAYCDEELGKDDFSAMVSTTHTYMENRIDEGQFKAGFIILNLGEKPSPSGEDFSKFVICKYIENGVTVFMI